MARKIKEAKRSVLGRIAAILCLLLVLLAGAAGAWLYGYANQPLPVNGTTDFVLEAGSFNRAAEQLQAQGVIGDVRPFLLLGRLMRADKRIKAGSYEIDASTTPVLLLEKLTSGDTSMVAVKILEGWNWRQLKAALLANEAIKHDASQLEEAQLVAALKLTANSVEGQFFPDTYYISKGGSELEVLARANRLMMRKLDAAWSLRSPALPLKNQQEALILASLVEKETGHAADRPLIAGVFVNRLKVEMRLQTDPSVIYGLGDKFDGNLHRSDLEKDTPWNTYTRGGLPPTPIAFVGEAALKAATQPAQTRALYFVARGDGSSQFSNSLEEHNAAVRKYLLRH